MTVPQILTDLLQLLFDMAVPAAMCTMVLAGLALRQESGVNFEVGGSSSAVLAPLDFKYANRKFVWLNSSSVLSTIHWGMSADRS